ncbi:MFS transporter [Corynebacterium breve]|uniref:MFS transporter n=1 Tax=Corynebacterium breve TaxID=3049799 RepID=A0ABY8VHK9_9CORY|nr:MFS transporter [Corynebacterium breve]WIM68436.1 MFS transporter [Corynebacterium breve]
MQALLLFVAVFSAAINLRAGISSVGAVLNEVLVDLNAPASVAGIITAMPGAFFCIMGLCAVPLARRVGTTPTILGGAILTALGLAIRPFSEAIGLFLVCTVGVVGGIAVANVLLPAWIKQHGIKHILALTMVYSGALGLSGAVGPLTALLSDSWRSALGLWAFPAALQVLVWLIVLFYVKVDVPRAGAQTADLAGSMWRSPTAVALMLFFGLQSMNGYIEMGWLPKILVDAGVAPGVAAIGLSIIGFSGAVGGLLLPTVIARVKSLTPWVIAFGGLTALGWLALLVAPAVAPLTWSLVLGVGGWCFPLAIGLIPSRTRSPLVTAKLSGFVQPYGYVIAALGPLLVGIAYEQLQSFAPILVVLILLAVLMGLVGIRGARSIYIDDELAAQR